MVHLLRLVAALLLAAVAADRVDAQPPAERPPSLPLAWTGAWPASVDDLNQESASLDTPAPPRESAAESDVLTSADSDEHPVGNTATFAEDDRADTAAAQQPVNATSDEPLGARNESVANTEPSRTPTWGESTRDWHGVAIDRVLPTVVALLAVGIVPMAVLAASSFIRIMIILSLLRQALGTAQVPPNQVLNALALLLTALVMMPVWSDVYQRAEGIPAASSSADEWSEALEPIQTFMARQIQATGNWQDIWLFLQHVPEATSSPPETYEDVPLRALLPAFVLSELKTAFLIGFQIYLPFLVIDLVVSTATMAMGMLMLPPQAISIPLKLLLFVMVDGWHLVAELVLRSFVPLG